MAQSTDGKASEQSEPAAQQARRQSDEFTEAARLVNGPAGNPECVWLGRRVVALLAREETESAHRHLELYDRFGCPGPHIQTSFRCVIRQGASGPDAEQALPARVHACWLNPSAPAAATATPPALAGSANR
jgi:hypothetical protein